MGYLVSVINAIETHHVSPPQLDAVHLGKHILCHRPTRKDSPAMFVEKKGDKIIAHNYGHGGSGWTLGPGAASYVIGRLEIVGGESLTKETPITIIGAGALGLLTALHLVDKGYTAITIVADRFDDLTSHKAAGLVAPVSMKNDPHLQKIVNQVGIESYLFFKKIAKETHPIVKRGAVIVPAYFRNRDESSLEYYVASGVMEKAKEVVLDFGNGTKHTMVVYEDGIFIDVEALMMELRTFLNGRVTFKQQHIKHLGAVASSFIINCSGIGAKALAKDHKMVPVQGHLIRLRHQNPADLQYMIYVSCGTYKNKAGFTVERFVYLFPKTSVGLSSGSTGVLGGTFIEGADDQHPNQEEFALLIKRAKTFFGIKS